MKTIRNKNHTFSHAQYNLVSKQFLNEYNTKLVFSVDDNWTFV